MRATALTRVLILAFVPILSLVASMLLADPCYAGSASTSHWSNSFHAAGPDGNVLTFATYNGDLYIAGSFQSIGPVRALDIARFNGTTWSDVGGGLTGGYVSSLVEYRGELYAAGSISMAGDEAVAGIARWDGSSWRPAQGSWITNFTSLAVHGDTLYAAGYDESGANVEAWDGGGWTLVGGLGHEEDPPDGDRIHLAWYQDRLYAGVFRTLPDGGRYGEYSFVSQWDGVHWVPLDPIDVFGTIGMLPQTTGLQVFGDRLYATGAALGFGPDIICNLASYDGSAWQAEDHISESIEFEDTEYMSCILPYGDGFLAGGYFSGPGNGTSCCIAQYSGSTWSPFPGGGIPLGPYNLDAAGSIGAMSAYGGNVYVAGDFEAIGSEMVEARHLARWDGSAWSAVVPPGEGFRDQTDMVAMAGDTVVIGGAFTSAGTVPAEHIAFWDGDAWHQLGSGLDGAPEAVVPYQHGIVVGGQFSHAGGLPASNIAYYDFRTGEWSGLGTPPPAIRMTALTMYNMDLIAGGYSESSPVLARWNGSVWQQIEGAPFHNITGLAVFGGILFATGYLDGSIPAAAAWDGQTWGSTFQNVGSPLAIFHGDLYATGAWSSGYNGALVRWNGASFTPVPMGGPSSIGSLTICGDRLVAAGFIQRDTGKLSPIIAYDGNSWTAFEPGPPSGVRQVAGNGTTLAVTGTFNTVGGMGSIRFALWHDDRLPVAPYRIEAARADTTVRIAFDVDAPDAIYRVCSGALGQDPVPVTESLFTGARHYELIDRMPSNAVVEYSVEQLDRAGGRIALFGAVRVPSLAAQVFDFRAERNPSAIRLRWSVDAEHPNAIFRLYRESDAGSGSGSGLRSGFGSGSGTGSGAGAGERVPLDITPERDSTGTRYSALDPAPPSAQAAYWIEEIMPSGRSIAWSGPANSPSVADLWSLRSLTVAPNPTRSSTAFAFSLPSRMEARLAIYDLGGRRVASLPAATLGVGPQIVAWDGRGSGGRLLPQGVYVARLRTAAGERSTRVVLVR